MNADEAVALFAQGVEQHSVHAEALAAIEGEIARLREQDEVHWRTRKHLVEANARLREALDKAGDRLAQVQPGVTEPWAFDIIPLAEREIADALEEDA